MNRPQVRYFVLCENIEYDEHHGVKIIGVIDGFMDHNFPSINKFQAMLGINSMMPGTYSVEIIVSQNGEELGGWEFNEVVSESVYSTLNFIMSASEFEVVNPGEILFDFLLNGESIGQQTIFSVKEEAKVGNA